MAPSIEPYRGVVCDLDGVVYRGAEAIPGAADTVNRLTRAGVPVVFATNNASRPPEAVAEHLDALGLQRPGWSVVTSSEAAAARLAGRLAPGARVLAVGGPGVPQALSAAGLTAVRRDDLGGGPVEAVVQGLGVDVAWNELAEIGYLVQSGVPWIATNLDAYLPTVRGMAPGNGAMVAAVRTVTSVGPEVVGKPGPALFELARARLGTPAKETLVCGDRLDTDIAGANAAGLDSLFVLSGAHRLRDLAFAPQPERPTYVAADLTGLLEPCPRLDTPHHILPITAQTDIEIDLYAEHDSPLHLLVTSVWSALDSGIQIRDDPARWTQLEHDLTRSSA